MYQPKHSSGEILSEVSFVFHASTEDGFGEKDFCVEDFFFYTSTETGFG
jgi:hypothetical protein